MSVAFPARFPARFQFTPLREGRQIKPGDPAERRNISIHAPPRGATRHAHADTGGNELFQFTPLREGRPNPFSGGQRADKISIHAPPRGATQFDAFLFRIRIISIHAPPRGATRTVTIFFVIRLISIHAPPRGATHPKFVPNTYIGDFNSRPSARGDAGATQCVAAADKFQFTPLREGRPLYADVIPTEDEISIHAPPRGATRPARAFVPPACYFNSRPSARGDLRQNRYVLPRHISIHAPPRGATRAASSALQRSHFNSRPSARGDAKDMQFLQIFCSTLTNQHGLTIVPRNLSRLFW